MDEPSSWRRRSIIAALGTSQTLAWASSYYLIAILADPMSQSVGTTPTLVFAAFSASLLITALIGPRVGRTIDQLGGRGVLAVSNIVFAGGLTILAIAPSPLVMWLGWLVIGLGMGLGLYDAAFATLGGIFGDKARGAITGITLIAGFASTIGWPLTAWGLANLGWRETCAAWAVAHVVLGLPLNLSLPQLVGAKLTPADQLTAKAITMDRAMWLLGLAFAAGWVVSTAMAAHLPRLLEAAGATTAQALTASAMIGPAQVAARIAEASFLKRFSPLASARLSTIAHPIGAALLLFGGGWFALPFAVLHGAGNGILTIARGTVPLAVFGHENYGYRLGLLGAPARIAQAGAPLAFGYLIEVIGSNTLLVTSMTCLAALAALTEVGRRDPAKEPFLSNGG